ncbi:hypothetical protein C0J45_23886, partial [Silurus meridionalis]
WRRVAGVICDRRESVRVKGKVYKTVVRPEMLYGLETLTLSKRQEVELEVAELKMLRFSLRVTRMGRILTNKFIKGKAREGRLRWFVHVQRRDMGYISRRMLRMEPPERMKRERPKRRFMDVMREDMQVVGLKEADAEDRWIWRQMIHCGNP